MKSKAGVWIDHGKAIVVRLTDTDPIVREINSEAGNHSQSANGTRVEHAYTRNDFVAEDRLERKNDSRLNKYYDEVIASLDNADSILILGPGEAKGELVKRIASMHFQGHIEHVQTADKMTDAQILAHVRQYFKNVQDSQDAAKS